MQQRRCAVQRSAGPVACHNVRRETSTMHLQQTKKGSIKTGGPQYYFHDLDDSVRLYLRKKGKVPVALVTPYGATKSDFFALGKDHKLGPDGAVVPGRVGHDRIQQGGAAQSIGEDIRHWYRLKTGTSIVSTSTFKWSMTSFM